MASRDSGAGCRKLLGLTSSGQRVVCGKAVARITSELCPTHEEFRSPCSIMADIDSETAERLYARAQAYGIPLSKLIGSVLHAGMALNLDAPQ